MATYSSTDRSRRIATRLPRPIPDARRWRARRFARASSSPYVRLSSPKRIAGRSGWASADASKNRWRHECRGPAGSALSAGASDERSISYAVVLPTSGPRLRRPYLTIIGRWSNDRVDPLGGEGRGRPDTGHAHTAA